jgi:hypothetical protein
VNRDFVIDAVTFKPQHEPGEHLGAGHCVRWTCKLCRWNGRTTPRHDENRAQEDAQNVALQHGYGRCVP